MLDLNLIEPHPQRVLEAFRRGEFEQIEIIGQADEQEFFELCFREKILEALAKEFPTHRKKAEVPSWFLLAGNLSLKLHLWEDAWALGKRCPWQELAAPAPEPKIAPSHRPEVIVRRELKRQKTLAAKKAQEPPPPIRPRCGSAPKCVRSKALAVGPNAPCRSTSCSCASLTPMATGTSGP